MSVGCAPSLGGGLRMQPLGSCNPGGGGGDCCTPPCTAEPFSPTADGVGSRDPRRRFQYAGPGGGGSGSSSGSGDSCPPPPECPCGTTCKCRPGECPPGAGYQFTIKLIYPQPWQPAISWWFTPVVDGATYHLVLHRWGYDLSFEEHVDKGDTGGNASPGLLKYYELQVLYDGRRVDSETGTV